MRVWLINHYAVSPAEPGGTRHWALAKQLLASGHEVLVLASAFNHSDRSHYAADAPGVRVKVEDGVPFAWIATPPYSSNDWRRVVNMIAFSRRVWGARQLGRTNPPDLVIGSSPHPFAALAAERIAHAFKIPFILEIRDVWPQALVDFVGLHPMNPGIIALGFLERWLYSRASRVITVLQNGGPYLQSRGVSAERIVSIPNGVDLSLVPEPTPPSREEGAFVVTYAGAHGPPNALDAVLDAAAVVSARSTNDIRFKLVGDGPSKPYLIERTRQERITNVEFHDAVPKTDVYAQLVGSDVLIVNTPAVKVYDYGFSLNKLFDYMACARPVVLGTVAANDPIQEAGAGRSVPGQDGAALASAVLELHHLSTDVRWEMGLRGRRYVEQNHDFAVLGARLEGVLLRTLEERAGSR